MSLSTPTLPHYLAIVLCCKIKLTSFYVELFRMLSRFIAVLATVAAMLGYFAVLAEDTTPRLPNGPW